MVQVRPLVDVLPPPFESLFVPHLLGEYPFLWLSSSSRVPRSLSFFILVPSPTLSTPYQSSQDRVDTLPVLRMFSFRPFYLILLTGSPRHETVPRGLRPGSPVLFLLVHQTQPPLRDLDPGLPRRQSLSRLVVSTLSELVCKKKTDVLERSVVLSR